MNVREQLGLIVSLSCIFLLAACIEDRFMPNDGLDYSSIDKAYIYPLSSTAKHLKEADGQGKADFIYITDTHYGDNCLYSPDILNFLVKNGCSDRVIWGGDAITAYGNIEYEWREHQKKFLDAVVPKGRYYQVRGNHEFTSMGQFTKQGTTYDARRTTQMLFSHIEPDVVRPADDPEACYYYVDDAEKRIRYCIFDTTDSISSTTDPWGTLVHTSQKQLDWMETNALHHVPSGYGLIVISHIGLIPETYAMHEPLKPIRQMLHHAEAPVLMVLSGHMHQDFQTYDHGILHVLTGSDADYPEYAYSPFLHSFNRNSHRSFSQLIDCFCVSQDRKTISAFRIGAGYDRTFHLDTLSISISSKSKNFIQTRSIPKDKIADWDCYNATGYQCLDAPWQPKNDIVSISREGSILPLRPGQAVIMATDHEGNKEFFPITVVQ